MLRISREQIDGLTQVELWRYEQALGRHVSEHFPRHAAYLGHRGILQVVRRGAFLAIEHGSDSERDICLYTDLAIMLGSGFTTDPVLSWAQDILADPTLADPRARIDGLWAQAMAYMNRILGIDGIFPVHAYQAHGRRRGGRACPTSTDENTLISYLHEIWPEKAEYAGAANLRSLLRECRDVAARHGVRGDAAYSELLIHSFLLGHRFYDDPLYPSAAGVMNDDAVHPEERVDRMVMALDAHLRAVLM